MNMNMKIKHLAPRGLPGPSRHRGFTLLEVLIAMLVLAIGLLGIAAMQLRGLQYSHDAYIRSQISVLASDIADRIRLNKANASDYEVTHTVTVTRPTGCTNATATANNDLTCWHAQVYDALPPDSKADISADAAGMFTVTLSWRDKNDTNNFRNISYTFMP